MGVDTDMADAGIMVDHGAAPAAQDGEDTAQRGYMHRIHRAWKNVAAPVRWVVYTLLTIILLIFLVWLVLFITHGRFLKHSFENIASRSLEREVKVDGDFELYFAPIQVKFVAEKLRIANPKWASKDALFSADRIDTRISTWRLIFGDVHFRRLLLDRGAADLEWSPDGKSNTWTFAKDEPAEPFEMPHIRQASIKGTTIRYRDPRLQLSSDIAIDTVRARDTRFTDDIRFHGDGRMNVRPFTLSGSLMSPNETLAGGRNKLSLNAASGPTHMAVSGTLPSATEIEGADLAMEVRGPNLSLLFDFLGVAIPDTRTYRIRSTLTYEDKAWKFTGLKGMFGASDLAGRMTISMPNDRLKLDANLATNTLDIIDIGPFVGYEPNRLAQSGFQAAVSQPGGNPRVLPDAPLRVEALKRFDADVRYAVKRVRAESFPVSNIGLTMKLDRSLLTLDPLTFTMAGGKVASDISIDARKQPVVTHYNIRLSPTPMGTLLARWGVERSGTTGTLKAHVQMTGEGDSVRKSLASSDGRIAVIMPAGTMWARNIQLAELDIGVFIQKMFEKKLKTPVEINCGLVAFTVRDGVASADPILIDTKKNVMLGTGGFSFKDESLDLKIRADGKKFSLFSGQSPIGVKGYFAQPRVDPISPELLTRAGVGVGLGAALTPLASVLAFVDFGDAKSASCGPVLSGARAASQTTKSGKPRDDVGDGGAKKGKKKD